MPRMAPPEGAKKLYMDEKIFKRLEKLTAEVAAVKKAFKKGTVKVTDVSVAVVALSDFIAQKWPGIKEASGIKPPVAVPAKKPVPPKKGAPVPAPKAPVKRRTPTEVAKAKLDQLNGAGSAGKQVASPAEA